MALEISSPRSRRAILAGAVGAAAASVAGALGRPAPAAATNGGAIILGTFASDTDGTGPNAASSTTKIVASAGTAAFAASNAAGYGLWGLSVSNSGVRGSSSSGAGVYGVGSTGVGLHGVSNTNYGVYGTSTQNIAVYAYSPSHIGLYAYSNADVAIHGLSAAPEKAAIRGQSALNSTAVLGFSGPAAGPTAVPKTGVYGVAVQDAGAVGVRGDTLDGSGVLGFSGTGEPSIRAKTAVYGQANHGATGVGVRGHSSSGTGLYGSSTSGRGLRVGGRAVFDHCVGVATVAIGTNSIVVTPGIELVAASAVVATLMSDAGGSTAVKRVAVDATANTFRIILTAPSTTNAKVAWHVFG